MPPPSSLWSISGKLSWKQTFWKSTRKYSFDCSVAVESLGDRKQEQQEYTFPQGQHTYLMWHGLVTTCLWLPPLSCHLRTGRMFFGYSQGGRRELKLQSFRFFMIFLSIFQINHSNKNKTNIKTPEKQFLNNILSLLPSVKMSMRVRVWHAFFILTFFPRCWHDVSLNSPSNVHTWPLHFTSKLSIMASYQPMAIIFPNAPLFTTIRQHLSCLS